jgi:hypothetical protein
MSASNPPMGPGDRTQIKPRDAGGTTKVTGASRGAISPKTLELGRGFLSALFMGLRTAQIHDPSNRAFERAVQGVRVAADALYAATGGFTINFVDESAFLNGIRLRFDGGAFDAMRTLRHILESKDLGGIEMRAPPSYDAIRKLILLFAPHASSADVVSKDDLLALQIGILGVQRFADASRDGLRVDRRIFALQCYAKLLLAFREQCALATRVDRTSHAPRLRAVRVVQDLVELCGDRADFLLRLGSNHAGAPADELHAVNVSVLSVALGHALGFGRQELVDIGVSALFHDVARTPSIEPPPVPHPKIPVLNADAPVPYDGVLELASPSASQEMPVPYEGPLEVDEDEAPPMLPVEYIGEIRPLDPAEAGSSYSFEDSTDAGTAEVAIPDPAEGVPLELDASALQPVDADPGRATVDANFIGGDTQVQYVGPYHPGAPAQAADEESGHPEERLDALGPQHTLTSFSRMLVAGGLSRNGLLRAVVAAEHHVLAGEELPWGQQRPATHLFSRIVAVADAYDALTSGIGSADGKPMHPIDALEMMRNDPSGRVDPRLVDLLINVLRAYPVGTEVVLDNGDQAVVVSHAGGTRWDRPVVRTVGASPKNIDLMTRQNDRFITRIVGTAMMVGDQGRTSQDLDAPWQ